MEKESVLEYLESRIRDNPKSLLFARLADAYLVQGRIDDGMLLCTEGVKNHPYYGTGYYVLAKAHVMKKEYDRAESALKKVLSHDQQYLAAQKMLADILVKTGWEATAVDHYAAVLEIDPFEEKIRELMKRYASKPAPKTPLLEPSEDPSAALDEELPPVAPESPARTPDEPAIQPAAETPPPFKPDETFPDLPDWTDEIREFNPDDGSPPPVSIRIEPEAGFGAFDEPVNAPSAPVEDAGAQPSGTEPEPAAPPEVNLFESPAVGPETAGKSAAKGDGKPAQTGEELVDFTQDWFDLSSFETIEEEKPKEAQPAEPPLDIVEAGSLFEKDEPREILAPSDLFQAETEKPPQVPPLRKQPAAAPPPDPPRKAAAFDPPKPKAQEEPQPRPVVEPPPQKSDDKAELKIVTSTLGEIYAVQGQFDKAILVYEALLEKNPAEQKYLDKIADLKKKLRESSGK
jgi:tetratricopeptide (TPR) repeat protein